MQQKSERANERKLTKKPDIFEKFKPSRKKMAIKLCELREEVMTDTFWLNYLNLRKVDQKVKFYPLIFRDFYTLVFESGVCLPFVLELSQEKKRKNKS